MRPVVALYSTFLQRAFDQTVHDVCQNDQPVLIAVDRAGLVGEDGTSHQGMFTLPAQRQLPNLVIASPEGRAGAALAAPHRARARTTRSRCTTRATPGFGAAAESSRRSCRSGGARCCARARDLLFVGFGPIVGARRRGRRRARRRGLVGRRHQRPVRQAARPPADPRPGARQAARRHVRGERRRPAGSAAACSRLLEEARLDRPGLPRRRRSGSSASRATGSSTTARWPTCGGPAARRGGPRRAGARGTGDPPRRAGPLGGGRGLAQPGGGPLRPAAAHCARLPHGRVVHVTANEPSDRPESGRSLAHSCMGRPDQPTDAHSVSVTAMGCTRSSRPWPTWPISQPWKLRPDFTRRIAAMFSSQGIWPPRGLDDGHFVRFGPQHLAEAPPGGNLAGDGPRRAPRSPSRAAVKRAVPR